MSNNLLSGKKGIITGALDENSIAWQTALKAKEQGARFVLTNAHFQNLISEIDFE